VPITSIRVQNFKCFRDSGPVKVAPVTMIFGRNNAGKSTLLQSLLLLRQTLDSGGFGASLNLRGPLFSAGSYVDLVHNHKAQENIKIEIGITPAKSRPAIIELEYRSEEPRPPRLVSFAVRVGGKGRVEIKRGRGRSGPYELHIDSERLGLEKEANFAFPAHGLLPVIGPEPQRVGRPNERREAARYAARVAVAYLEQCLATLRALGPFRQPPQRRYDFAGYIRDSVDAEGRNVVEALIDDATRRGRVRGRLLREVNQWLRAVGGVQLLPIRRLGRSARIYELRLKHTDSGRWANFADVGSGIGQAFPVLVEGLRTPIGGTFLVQEPEIHLHPDAQLGVGDFLISLAEEGRFVIAETHSENILLRIRRRIAQRNRAGDLKASDVSVLFVDTDDQANSIVRELQLDELGQIENWPKGFMEHATEERMQLLEASASRTE
jgi:predicted ATPase